MTLDFHKYIFFGFEIAELRWLNFVDDLNKISVTHFRDTTRWLGTTERTCSKLRAM